MGKDLSTQTATTGIAPAVSTRELSLTVARIHNAVRQLTWNRWEIAAERAPSAVERMGLEQRRAELEAGLEPADARTALAALSRMFVGFANTAGAIEPEDAWARAEAYVECVRDQPLWAIRKACDDWRDGKHGKSAFAPSTAQFAPTVSAETLPFRTELGKLNAVLDAKVVGADDKEARARCFAMGMEAAAQMRETHFNAVERQAVAGLDELLAQANPGMSAEERKATIEGLQRAPERSGEAKQIGSLAKPKVA